MAARKKMSFLILFFIACIGLMASDIYTPSVPAIAAELQGHVSQVQWSMAIYMIGLAVSQLIYGPLSEGFGRKPLVLIGLAIMFIGDLICVFSHEMDILILGRLIQGIGAGSCAALWRSMFRDMFDDDELSKYSSYLTVMVIFVIPAAPILGGYLQHFFNWRASFVFLAVYAVFISVVVKFMLEETHKARDAKQLSFTNVVNTYKSLLLNKQFIGYALCVFLTYGGFFSWYAVAPVLLIEQLKISPVAFGWILFFTGVIATSLSALINGRLIKQKGTTFMLTVGWSLMAIAALQLLFGYYVFGLDLYVIVLSAIIYIFGANFIWPNAFAASFKSLSHVAGYAAALYGCFQIGGAGVIGALVSHLPHDNQVPLSIVLLAVPVIALLLLQWITFGAAPYQTQSSNRQDSAGEQE